VCARAVLDSFICRMRSEGVDSSMVISVFV
jgi:hypothetical protein